jgi:hypothetical protein
MKYMIMMFGNQETVLATKSQEWIREMIEFMGTFTGKIQAAGELITAEGLADATQAKTVRIENGLPVASDGPFAESKESLAGYWIVDVADEARAIELASEVVAFTHGPVEVRQVMDAAPEM